MKRNTSKLLALAAGVSLIVAACGGDDSGTTTEAPGTEAPSSEAPSSEAPSTDAPAETAMTITYDLADEAVWDDGSPITVADFQCTWNAVLNTPGSISTSGYDKIIDVVAGESDKQVIVTFNEVYAPWKGLFSGLVKNDAVEDCNDISADFADSIPFSGTEWKMDSWSTDGVTYVPNEAYWGPRKVSGYEQLVMVPKPDTEIAALKAGEVDFIYPQFYAGIEDELADPNVTTKIEFGGDYEALYMNMSADRPFADPAVREAFYKSIDVDALFAQIYTPIAPTGELLTCGPIVPGDYCPEGIFGNKYDQAAADQIMTDAGYAKDADGIWAKDGQAVEIKWMVNAGNTRRENTQAYLIPLLAEAGFKLVADNCDAACVFQTRLPSGDYDLAMYISTAPPDPAYLVAGFTCDNIPTEENGNQGQNSQGWCNEEASQALHDSDKTVDEAARAELIKSAITAMDTDNVLIPLFQFPKSGAYRKDLVGNVEGELNNYAAFNDTYQWTDLNGDGKVIIGAEQWPECLNPVTECANSSWYVWTVANVLMPGVYRTTNDQKYELTELMKSEPTVVTA